MNPADDDKSATQPDVPFGPPRRRGRLTVSLVWDDLLLGAYLVHDDFAWLRAAHGVTAVLCLQDDADLAARGLVASALAEASGAAGVKWRRIPVCDADVEALGLRLGEIVGCLAALRDAGERVYLHCSAGFNRAPTAAIAYLHVHGGLALDAATALVEERRSCAPYAEALRLFLARRR